MSISKATIPASEWFARPDAPEAGAGLRFTCTMCGNCCSGPPGYVLVSDEEVHALAARLKITATDFIRDYTNQSPEGRSLNERPTTFGNDCIFLDRTTVAGKAICGVYEDRPKQCRTWPFWPSLLASRQTWDRAKRTCPGLGKGTLIPIDQVRIQRDAFKI
jgi:Fe-S-cluster containining protein